MSAFGSFSEAISAAYEVGTSPMKEPGVNSYLADCLDCGGRQTVRMQETTEGPDALRMWCSSCNKRIPLGALRRKLELVREDSYGSTDPERTGARQLTLTCARDVAPEDVEWIDEGFFPLGKIAIVDGPPGAGKTTLLMDSIARASRGALMPGSDRRIAPVNTLIAGVEDGWADTIRPRLDAANADLSRIFFVTVTNHGTFTIPDDVELLTAAVRKHDIGWVHMDSIMGSLSESVRTNSDHDVRRALRSLGAMAEETKALVTLIRHPKKAGAVMATDAGGGSIAFSAVARCVSYVGFDPTDQTEDLNQRRRVWAPAKNNLGRMMPSRSFQISTAANGRPCIAYGGPSPVTADELASAPMRQRFQGGSGAETATKKASAEQWLEEALAGGVRPTVDELKISARQCKLSWRTVERAAADLGVTKQRGKVGECSVWYLPSVAPAVAPNTSHTESVGGTVTHQSSLDFPIPPPVAPLGGTGATDEAADSERVAVHVPPTATPVRSDGGTDDPGYLASLEADAERVNALAAEEGFE